MRKLLATTAIVAGALWAMPASADIIFTLGNHPQADEQNILFGSSEIGVTLANGEVGHTGAGVRFTSLTQQIITQNAQGQADIFCAFNCVNNGGNQSSQLSSIRMSAGLDANNNLTAWTDAIINLDFGSGTAHVVATDQLGGSFNYDLGPGQNFLTMVVAPGSGEVITRIDVTGIGAGFGFNSFKQPRVSGLCTLQSATSCVPIETAEPATIATFGVGLLGLMGLAKRKRLL